MNVSRLPLQDDTPALDPMLESSPLHAATMDTSAYYKYSIRHLHITANSILVGDEGAAFYVVHCSRNISDPNANPAQIYTRATAFEANVHGIPCIAKCSHPHQTAIFRNECLVYDRLARIQSSAQANVFAKAIGWGKIVCSSVFPTGNILLLEKRPGRPLTELWADLTSEEKTHVQTECMKAIGVLRSISIRLADTGKHNVLFDRETGAVTLLDFEYIGFCEYPEDTTSLEPEMSGIFGNDERWVWWVRA